MKLREAIWLSYSFTAFSWAKEGSFWQGSFWLAQVTWFEPDEAFVYWDRRVWRGEEPVNMERIKDLRELPERLRDLDWEPHPPVLHPLIALSEAFEDLPR